MSVLAAFDFDFTLVDNDSDCFVFDKLSPELRKKMSELSGVVQWTDLMHQLLGELNSAGVSKAQIIGVLGNIEFNPAILQMFEAIKSSSGDVIIVSDANSVYIDEILKAKNGRQFVTEIVTNPGSWDASGRLNVERKVKPPAIHGCPNVCSVNLCKGAEILQRMNNYDLVIYGGDGKNDFCPMTKLRSTDVALVRRGHSLEAYLKADAKRVENIKARVLWWTEANEMLTHVQTVLGQKQ